MWFDTVEYHHATTFAMVALLVYLHTIGDVAGIVLVTGALVFGEVVYQGRKVREACGE